MESGGYFRNGESLWGELIRKRNERELRAEMKRYKARGLVPDKLKLTFKWLMWDMMDLPPSTADVGADRLHDVAL